MGKLQICLINSNLKIIEIYLFLYIFKFNN